MLKFPGIVSYIINVVLNAIAAFFFLRLRQSGFQCIGCPSLSLIVHVFQSSTVVLYFGDWNRSMYSVNKIFDYGTRSLLAHTIKDALGPSDRKCIIAWYDCYTLPNYMLQIHMHKKPYIWVLTTIIRYYFVCVLVCSISLIVQWVTGLSKSPWTRVVTIYSNRPWTQVDAHFLMTYPARVKARH